MRDFLIGEHGQEKADSIIPDYLVRDVERASEEELEDSSFAAPETETTPNTPSQEQEPEMADKDDKDQTADFAAREADLIARLKALEDQEAKTRNADIDAFAEKMVDAGKVLPVQKDGMVSFMASLGDEDTVSFAASEGNVTQSPDAWFRSFVETLPVTVDFSEYSADDQEDITTASFAAPVGYEADPDGMAAHQRALNYQAQHKCDYATAVRATAQG